jgi:hypothetical protein
MPRKNAKLIATSSTMTRSLPRHDFDAARHCHLLSDISQDAIPSELDVSTSPLPKYRDGDGIMSYQKFNSPSRASVSHVELSVWVRACGSTLEEWSCLCAVITIDESQGRPRIGDDWCCVNGAHLVFPPVTDEPRALGILWSAHC